MTRPRAASEPDVDAVVAAESFRRIVRSLRLSASATERAAGISSAQLLVLGVLSRHPGIGLGEVAHHTLSDPSSVSVVLARLVAGGLAVRRADPEDGRRVRLDLTARGRDMVARAPASAPERFLRAVTSLSPPLRRALARGLAEVVHAMGAETVPASLFFEETSPGARRRGSRR